MIGIYKITNKINGKIYVGQSIDIIERWKQHKYKAFNTNEIAYNSAIHSAFRKYGIENFELSILEECDVKELDIKERYWIEHLNSLSPYGYNILIGGQKFRNVRLCIKCGKPIHSCNVTQMCIDCYNKDKSSHIPSCDELKNTLNSFNGNFSKVGIFYGVTDNAVRRWCKKYNMPYHSKDYKHK